MKNLTKATTAHVSKAVRGRVVSFPGDEERGVKGTWHIVSVDRSERHPLDRETYTSRREAQAALDAFEK